MTPAASASGAWNKTTPPNLWITTSQTITGVDFDGWSVQVDANAAVVFNDCNFGIPKTGGSPAAGYGLSLGVNSGSANSITCNYCSFDFYTATAGAYGEIKSNLGCAMTFDHCRFLRSNGDFVVLARHDLTLTNNYITAHSLNPGAGTHTEGFHIWSGVFTMSDNMHDISGAAGVIYTGGAGITSLIYPSSGAAGDPDTTGIISNNILTGVVAVNSAVPNVIPATLEQGHGSPATNVTLTYTNNVLDKGFSNYLSVNSGTVTDSGNNRDFSTGAIVAL